MFSSITDSTLLDSLQEKIEEINPEEKKKIEENKEIKRKKLIEELHSTEKTYLDSLEYLNSVRTFQNLNSSTL